MPLEDRAEYERLVHELGHLAHYHQDVLKGQTALDFNQEVARNLYFPNPAPDTRLLLICSRKTSAGL